MVPGRRFQAAVFDMDGLLLDSERPIRDAWLRLSAATGTPLSEADYLQTVGRNRPDSLVLMAAHFGSLAAAEAMYEAVDASLGHFELKPGALALLQALRQAGVPCAVASSTRHAEVLRRLGAAGVLGFFGAVHGGDQVARGKPHPDLFELAAVSLGIHPASALAFEDSGHGARSALTAGMSVVLVPDLKRPEPEIAVQCLLLESLDHALPLVPAWFGTATATPLPPSATLPRTES